MIEIEYAEPTLIDKIRLISKYSKKNISGRKLSKVH